VVQESLTNIHRHSGSLVAGIRISHSENEVLVVVEDRGKGMSHEKRAEIESGGKAGVGIRGMRERLRQLGGTLEVGPVTGSTGTAVIARLPVSRTSVEPVGGGEATTPTN
jgi:signal transduction histidine kinase